MTLAEKTRTAWKLTLILFVCLLIAIGIDHALLRPIFHWPKWLVQTLPLVLLPGLLKQQSRSAIWLCFMLLFNFLVFVDQAAVDNTNRTIYIALIMLCVTLFTTAMLFARWHKQLSHDMNSAQETSNSPDPLANIHAAKDISL